MRKKAALKKEDLTKALLGIEENRQISNEIVEEALQEALSAAFYKQFGLNKANDLPKPQCRVDFTNNEVHLYQEKTVVEDDDDITDDELQISLEEARDRGALRVQPGDMYSEEINIGAFDRAAITLAKNTMKQKIREAEKKQIYDEFKDRIDDMVRAQIETVEEKYILAEIDKTLAMMPKLEQIPGEDYREGEYIDVVITGVAEKSRGAQVMISRATPVFVRRLFEREVPEIYQGIIEIKAIARDPGERCKMAVLSHNENIDPIGACIGKNGSRVQGIINELNGEKIDIFQWSDNLQTLISNALAPAPTLAVFPNPNDPEGLTVVVPADSLSLAIGKRGKNAKLAVKLSNRKIDIKSDKEMEEAGIDYMGLAAQMQQQYEERKARELAYRQQQKKEALQNSVSDIESINPDVFLLADEAELPELPEGSLFESENQSAAPEEDLLPATEPQEEDLLPAVEEPERELSDIEKAALAAKEKHGRRLGENKAYTSRFESLAGAGRKEEEAAAAKPKKREADKEEKKPRKYVKKPAAAMMPIYSDEELAEIAEQENEDAMGSWDDDVDYEEYDSYYDD